MSSNFNHIVLSQQAAFGSCTTPILADGAVTPQKIGAQASVIIQDITYTAATGGVSGNNISITYVESVVYGQETVTVSGTVITVNIGNPTITIEAVLDSTHLQLVSTAGIQIGDTIVQGIHSTIVLSIVSAIELQVTSTTGFAPGSATDHDLLSTAEQVFTAVQNSYLVSVLVTAVITGIPANKQVGVIPTSLSGGQTNSGIVNSIQADSHPLLTGNVQLISGTSITLIESGNSITISASGAAAGVSSLNGLTNAITLAAGSNITITPGGNVLTIASTGGIAASNFITAEIPSGLINGVNTIFVLLFTPNPVGSDKIFLNGIRQNRGAFNDYTILGSTITFARAPRLGDILFVDYMK